MTDLDRLLELEMDKALVEIKGEQFNPNRESERQSLKSQLESKLAESDFNKTMREHHKRQCEKIQSQHTNLVKEFEELKEHHRQYHACGTSEIIIEEWYRKAKQYDNLVKAIQDDLTKTKSEIEKVERSLSGQMPSNERISLVSRSNRLVFHSIRLQNLLESTKEKSN